jgi:phospholipid-translocating ATPase
LRVGFLVSFVAPLIFVLAITMFKEAYDDYKRMIRDKEINDLIYERLDINGGKILKT